MMGCSHGDSECFQWELPAHKIEIEKPFWIGQTEVTQKAYGRMNGTNPSRYKGPNLPVGRISWIDASSYCERIGMRLPIEAEWEHAARGGNASSRYGVLEPVARFDGNSGDRTHEVSHRQPNAFGLYHTLYDTLGNVWEWVQDAYAANPSMKVLRGGSFFNVRRDQRVSNRLWALPETAHRNMGFRCAAKE